MRRVSANIMSRFYYIVYRALISHNENDKIATLSFIILQWLLFLLLPRIIIEALGFQILLPFIVNENYILVMTLGISIFDYFFYFREKATKRITIKYTNKYPFVEERPLTAFYLFIVAPIIILMLTSVIIHRNF